MNRRLYQRTDGTTDGRTDRRTDGRTKRRTKPQRDARTHLKSPRMLFTSLCFIQIGYFEDKWKVIFGTRKVLGHSLLTYIPTYLHGPTKRPRERPKNRLTWPTTNIVYSFVSFYLVYLLELVFHMDGRTDHVIIVVQRHKIGSSSLSLLFLHDQFFVSIWVRQRPL